MATYNKPGVYVEETLSPNVPINNTQAKTIAAFIGYADRGPTSTVVYNNTSNVVGKPTAITSWSQFNNLFEFNNAVLPFDTTIGSTIGSTNANVSPGKDLKYAVKSFFDNGGSQAIILRDINTDATAANVTLADGNSITSQAVSWYFNGAIGTNVVITATSGTPFTSFETGRVVDFSGITNTQYSFLNDKSWVVSNVAADGSSFSVAHNGVVASSGTLNITAISAGTVTAGIIGTSGANTINVGSSTGVVVNQAVTGTGVGTGATVQTITATTVVATGTGSSGQAVITCATTGVAVGMTITGTGVGTNSVVQSIGTGTVTASVNIATTLTGSNNITFGGATLQLSVVNSGAVSGTGTFYTGTVTYTVAPGNLVANQSVTIASATTAGYNGTFTVASVGTTNFTVTGNYTTGGSSSSATGTYSQAQAYTSTAPIVIQGGGTSVNQTIKISANSEGLWGNYIWVTATPSITPYAFDLTVFYSLTATTSADLTRSNVVQTFQNLTTDSTKTNYITKVITPLTSSWIKVTDVGATSTTLSSVNGSVNTNSLNVSSSSALNVGMTAVGTNIPANTLVTAISGSTVTLSAALTGTISSGSVTFNPPIGLFDHPKFTSYWSTSTTAANLNSSDYSFNWNVSKVTTGIPVGSSTPISYNAVKLGVTSSDVATYPQSTTSYAKTNYATASRVVAAATAGTAGTTAADFTNVTLPVLDAVTSQLVINYPKKVDSSSVNAMLTYAYNRGDSFVIIDGGGSASDGTSWSSTNTVADVITNGSGYNTHANYGAIYYPNIQVSDPATTNNSSITIPPGGAVAAVYVGTDASRGVFKAPAGISAVISNARLVPSLTNDEFNLVSNSIPYVNIIRPVSGRYCVMGARTISSATSDKFIPVRRSINYLSTELKAITQFAVFEPNDQNLWRKVTSVVNSFLYDYWRSGGLAGSTADEAYYVKCDADNNTSSSISNGELRVEIGVAVEQPAEFVIITIGQINGGATVATSV